MKDLTETQCWRKKRSLPTEFISHYEYFARSWCHLGEMALINGAGFCYEIRKELGETSVWINNLFN